MSVFTKKAPWLMASLMRDFPALDVLDAAAIAGNFGHETAGLEKLQETRPTVRGSRGGYGWPQWTGPRRRAYERWCKTRKLAPASDAANYGYVVHELTHTAEKRALAALRRAKTLATKTVAFEKAYERAGAKHYPSRKRWAGEALAAFRASAYARGAGKAAPPSPVPPPRPRPAPPSTGSGAAGTAIGGAIVAGAGTATAAANGGPEWLWWAAIGSVAVVVMVAIAVLVVRARGAKPKKRRKGRARR